MDNEISLKEIFIAVVCVWLLTISCDWNSYWIKHDTYFDCWQSPYGRSEGDPINLDNITCVFEINKLNNFK